MIFNVIILFCIAWLIWGMIKHYQKLNETVSKGKEWYTGRPTHLNFMETAWGDILLIGICLSLMFETIIIIALFVIGLLLYFQVHGKLI